MNDSVYERLVYLIDEHRTWVEVAGSEKYMVHTIQLHGKLIRCTCRTLELEARYRNIKYRHGRRWLIPEYELDKALAAYRRKNPAFRLRMKKDAQLMTIADVENLICIATRGVLKLRLMDF